MCVFKHCKFYFLHICMIKDIHFDGVLVHTGYCIIVEKLMKILLKKFLLPGDNMPESISTNFVLNN